MIVIGIDPGISGALAKLNLEAGTLEIEDMPAMILTKGKGRVRRMLDPYALANYFDGIGEEKSIAFIELSWPRPTDGPVAGFNFGLNYGIALMGAAANFIRVEQVSPMKWKRAMGVVGDKDNSRARASVLMPKHSHLWPLKKHDGRAEAALIACWGAWQIEKGLIGP